MNNMDNNGYYSFNENALPHASMNPFEQQFHSATSFAQVSDGNFTAGQTAANEAFTAEGAMSFADSYAFDENALPQPATNNLWQPMSNTYQEMVQSQYAFDQSALPQPALTNAFDFDNSAGPWDALNQQAFEQTLTDMQSLDWSTANALSSDTTGGWQPALLTGSDIDAPFEVDESDANESPHLPIRTTGNSHVFMDAALKCTFPGCAKTTSFKTEKLLMTHVENIHTFPLYCTQPGCPYRRPFPRKGDLDRHLASKHGIGRLFRCPRLDCPRHRRPYGRKDKLRDHVNDYAHGINHCQYDHCLLKSERGLFCQTDVTKHEQSSKHGEYECSIGDCAGSNSHFTKQGLSFHLSSHRIGPREVDIEKMLKPGKHVLRSEDINQLVYSDKTKATSCVDAYQSKSCTA